MKHASALLILFSLAYQLSHAQDYNPGNFDGRKHSIGIGLGLTTGNGLSYQYQPGRFGFQVNYGAQFKPRFAYSGGLTFMYNLWDGIRGDIFAYQGNHVIYWGVEPDSDVIGGNYSFFHGLGLGISKVSWIRVKFSLMVGAALYNHARVTRNRTTMGPTIEIGMHYLF